LGLKSIWICAKKLQFSWGADENRHSATQDRLVRSRSLGP
jgi:hypothetical protein